ncbi:MAG: hypothetical protein IJA87_09905 [Clostridia bacterium]|nr:hypothetical protein [Clostridia bacterium]
MEYAIAIFVGLWISAAGILAYYRIKKDFADTDKADNKQNKAGDQK